jgi:TolA-binding protein
MAGLLPADQLSESGFLHYLRESFARNDEDINELLIVDCQRFMRTFPQSQNMPDAEYILARIYDQDGQYFRAFVHYQEILWLYPSAAINPEVEKAGKRIIAEKETRAFESFVQKIDEGLAGRPAESSLSGRYFNYVKFLYELDHPDINPLLIDRIVFYLHTFDQDVINPDQLLFWMASLYRKQRDWLEAMMTYEKLIFIKPESALVPEVIFELGYIQYSEMGRHDEARNNFIRLITDYPEKEISGDAQFYLGELYQRKLDDPAEALTNYRLLIEAFPQNSHAVEALRRMAEIHYDADRYEMAIRIYEEIYDDYRSDPFAPEALIEIEDIYRSKLKDYRRAAETLLKYSDTYPNREDAAEMYYDAAEMYREELNDKETATRVLKAIVDKYPESRYAEKAKDDLAEMEGGAE